MLMKLEFESYEDVSEFAKNWLGKEKKEMINTPVGGPLEPIGIQPTQEAPVMQPVPMPIQQVQPSIAPLVQQVVAQQAQPVQPISQPLPTATIEYTVEQLAVAATQLTDAGQRDGIIVLLNKYGARSLMELKKEQYGAFATDLRGMGAKL